MYLFEPDNKKMQLFSCRFGAAPLGASSVDLNNKVKFMNVVTEVSSVLKSNVIPFLNNVDDSGQNQTRFCCLKHILLDLLSYICLTFVYYSIKYVLYVCMLRICLMCIWFLCKSFETVIRSVLSDTH